MRRAGYACCEKEWSDEVRGRAQVRLPHDEDYLHTVEPLFRYEIYRLRGAKKVRPSGVRSPALSQAATWDFDVATFGVLCVLYRQIL